ncbi:hypothetical protein cyc_06999 [Cyclospora cayetanensis]|uniref:Uncharacterized protein n=1 Tax=Cyclospora cayetanensis TaxID=88456 RepID=A0A1D3D861_9EIME|nr:hypothetical protein cyc_06999 [Cyclospora cayetanensis]
MCIAPFVGRATDWVHSRFPRQGRAAVAQLAILLRCLLMTIMLRSIDRVPSSLWSFLSVSCLIGLLAGWPGVGVNRPVLAEIVADAHRATVFSLVSTTEAVGAALLGAPLVGLLAERAFGYVPPAKKTVGAPQGAPRGGPQDGLSVAASSLEAADNAEALSNLEVGPLEDEDGDSDFELVDPTGAPLGPPAGGGGPPLGRQAPQRGALSLLHQGGLE